MEELKCISIGDKEYPTRLLNIDNPPKKLYVKGDYKLLNKNSIAIIGSRKCSEYGAEQAYKFAHELSTQGICIVSGLAIGIDRYAHLGSCKNEGKTIAVLGCGINKIYPEENMQLSEQILKNGGCIISECGMDEEANLKKFPKRNRIIAGIAEGTLLVEAVCNRSGSLVTTRYSNEQGKPVFCIPGDLGKSQSSGPNELIKKYGIITTEVEDIFNRLGLQYNKEILKKNRITKRNKNKIMKQIQQSNKEVNIGNAENFTKKQINAEYAPVYEVFKDVPLSINEIYLKSGLSMKEVNQIITMLELEGYIRQEAGNRYGLV